MPTRSLISVQGPFAVAHGRPGRFALVTLDAPSRVVANNPALSAEQHPTRARRPAAGGSSHCPALKRFSVGDEPGRTAKQHPQEAESPRAEQPSPSKLSPRPARSSRTALASPSTPCPALQRAPRRRLCHGGGTGWPRLLVGPATAVRHRSCYGGGTGPRDHDGTRCLSACGATTVLTLRGRWGDPADLICPCGHQ